MHFGESSLNFFSARVAATAQTRVFTAGTKVYSENRRVCSHAFLTNVFPDTLLGAANCAPLYLHPAGAASGTFKEEL